MIDLSVVIVSFNTKKLLLDCFLSVEKYTQGISYEVIVVDNASTDGSVQYIKNQKLKIKNTYQKLKVIENKENLGFSRANNQGMKVASGRYILLLNSDTKLNEDSLTKLVRFMDEHPQAGIASCKLLNPDGTTQSNGGSSPNLFRIFLWATFLDDIPYFADFLGGAYHATKRLSEQVHKQDWVSGAFFVIRKKTIEEVGVLDEKIFMYAEDLDYSIRAKKKGWEVWYVTTASITHIGSASGAGETVQFALGGLGKKGSILGEFQGLKTIYKKHYALWLYPALLLFLKVAAVLRLILFGILGRQKEATKVYARAFITA